MRNFLLSLGLGLAGMAAAQQVHLDPTGAGESLLPQDVVKASGLGYILVGSASTPPDPDRAWIARVSSAGVIWSKTLEYTSAFQAACSLPDGSTVAVGNKDVAGLARLLVARFDAFGDTLWVRTIASDESIQARGVAVESDTVRVVGMRGSSSNRQQTLSLLTVAGNVVATMEQPTMSSSHTTDDVLAFGDTTIVLGTHRFGSFSTQQLSLRAVVGGVDVAHVIFGNNYASDGFPSMSKLTSGGYAVSAAPTGGWGVIHLDQTFAPVDSLSASYYESNGSSLTNPTLVADASGIYLGGTVYDGNVYALVAKIDPADMSVKWTRTLSQNGSVSAMLIEGPSLVVAGADGALGGEISFLNKATGQIEGTPCDPNLPQFSLEQSVYPNLASGALSTGTWSSPTTSTVSGLAVGTYNPDFSDCETALPIELLSFSAKAEGRTVRLEWATATEHDNEVFTVERSADGLEFESVVEVPGAGNSQSTLHYNAVDQGPLSGVSYYRLRQTDYDGHSSLSPVVAVRIEQSVELVVWPNPLQAGEALHGITGAFEVFDLSGRKVFEGLAPSGLDLPAGIYVLHLADGRTTQLVTK